MDEDRIKVLHMVADGKINAEEGDRLLEALEHEGSNTLSQSPFGDKKNGEDANPFSQEMFGKEGLFGWLFGEGGLWRGGRQFQEEESRTLDAKGYSLVTLENTNGNVVVEGVEGDSLVMHVVKKVKALSKEDAKERLDAIRISVLEEKPSINITTDASNLKSTRNYSVDYRIHAPKKMAETIGNRNGNISVSDVDAKAEARTRNGNVHVSRIKGETDARTTNGNIHVTDVFGSVRGHTRNGNVELNHIAGRTSGSTTNGNVRAEISKWETGSETKLITRNGNVNLYVEENISARVKASVRNGTVKTDLAVKASLQTRRKLEGTLGSGEGMVDLQTTNGNVRFLKAT